MRLARILFPSVLVLAPMTAPSVASAQIGISVNITVAPPVLPVYDQPPIPADGYIWVPGYWAWGDDGYYWVPGTWVLPPEAGLLWTPGYWGWNDGVYVFNDGYWGPHVGFYGGIDYGFGYGGTGYDGCFWDHGALHYNRTVNNFGGVHITNVYNKTVINHNVNVSFHGGPGGVRAEPTAAEREAEHEQHHPPTAAQSQHREAAFGNKALHAAVNHGRPPIAATARPGQFSGHGITGAHAIKEGPAGGPTERHEGNRPGPGPGPGHNQDARKGPEPRHAPAAAPQHHGPSVPGGPGARAPHPPAAHPPRQAAPAARPQPPRQVRPPAPPRQAAPRPAPPRPAPHPAPRPAPHPAPPPRKH
jgi:WXXGXW repeat (2 copies)